ncbi:MAG TPA: wax ester/triacylglycerol synthase family O-acyltransferase [Solirubrobacterales bacterium]|jgi:WS/DGAT/MGAT family acyltransferase
MTGTRLSALDASFLAVETPTAHMHVGWAAEFSAPADGRPPSFSQLRDHIELRLGRAPRYRQKLAPVPFGLHSPEWIDDADFCVDRHVYRAPGPLRDLVDEVMSIPLRHDRPLWEIWICENTEDRPIAIVGKVHHCMVDGIAAVELASLLLDPTPEPLTGELDGWRAEPEPDGVRLLVRGARDRVREQLGLLRLPLRAAASPSRTAGELTSDASRVARALERLLRAAPASPLNQPLSPLRSLAWAQRPLDDLRELKRAYGTTVNDVLLAAVAGGARSFFARRGEEPVSLKAMVPVSVRADDDVLGNRVSFVFADLPCEEPDPVRRLQRVKAMMSERKDDREPEGADLAFKAAEHAPGVVQHAISRIFASPRTFNLVVSNIPGPVQPMYMLGCPLEAAYPVVPLADRHALSVGMTSVRDRACFGIYADREAIPDADDFARDVDAAIGELLAGVD